MNPWTKMLAPVADPTEGLSPNQAFTLAQTGGVGMDDPLREVAQNAHALAQLNNPYGGSPFAAAESAAHGPSSSDAGTSTFADNAMLQEFIDRQKAHIDSVQGLANKYRAKADAREGQLDLSPLLALNDSLNGGGLAKGYISPQEENANAIKAEDVVAKELQPLTSDVLKQYQSENSAVSREQVAALRALATNTRTQTKATELQNKADSELGGKLGTLGGRGINKSYGEAIRRGQNISDLLKRYPDLNKMPDKQVKLLYSEVDGLINAGAPTVAGIMGMTPESLRSTWESKKGEFFNEPQGAGLKAFISPMVPYVGDIIENSKNYLRDEHQNLVDSYQGRLAPSAYDRYVERINKKFPAKGHEAAAGGGGGAKPKTVTQGGHTYTLNEKTGKYE